ncbi:MAG: RDD family protein [Candidatus Thermoplasmatota archaeon]|nr:RDD family protein [Candidatus Thermoplasmatota archaeon]
MRVQAWGRPRSATLLERTLCYLLDAIFTFLGWVLLCAVLSGGDVDALTQDPVLTLVAGMLFVTVPFTYFTLLEGLTGTTPGKRSLGLAVVTLDGRPPGLYRATVRNVLRLAWALGPMGPLFLATDVGLMRLDEEDQRLGDLAAGTRVVHMARGWLPLGT